MKSRHRRQKNRRATRRRRRQRGGVDFVYQHTCSFDPYVRTDRFSMDGLIWNLKDHPEWVLKEVVNPAEGGALRWSKPVSVEIDYTRMAAEAGLAPRVIADHDCGELPVVYSEKGSSAVHYVGWIVMEKVKTQPPPEGSTATKAVVDLQSKLKALGNKRWDAHEGNVVYGTTASQPTPRWWAIDFGTI